MVAFADSSNDFSRRYCVTNHTQIFYFAPEQIFQFVIRTKTGRYNYMISRQKLCFPILLKSDAVIRNSSDFGTAVHLNIAVGYKTAESLIIIK